MICMFCLSRGGIFFTPVGAGRLFLLIRSVKMNVRVRTKFSMLHAQVV